MKKRFLLVIFFVLALTLFLAWAATAQGPEPPEPPPPWEERGVRPSYHPPLLEPDWEGEKPFPWPEARRGVGQGVGPAVALGNPGTVFRYVDTFGVTEQAYPADAQHLNRPNGLFVDGSDNVFVAEEAGARVLNYNSAGSNLLSIGTAGLHYVSEYVFQWPKEVALDNSGNIWVVDDNRATQYDSGGTFLQVFPDWDKDPWDCRDDNEHFCEPRGIAFDSTGKMYVSDEWNHRIQVYTFVSGTPVYSTTIGVTGVSGSDNDHFNEPFQIVIDSSDRLYVGDAGNYRVQRCTYTTDWTCETFHGTGSEGSGPDQLGWALGLGMLLFSDSVTLTGQ